MRYFMFGIVLILLVLFLCSCNAKETQEVDALVTKKYEDITPVYSNDTVTYYTDYCLDVQYGEFKRKLIVNSDIYNCFDVNYKIKVNLVSEYDKNGKLKSRYIEKK